VKHKIADVWLDTGVNVCKTHKIAGVWLDTGVNVCKTHNNNNNNNNNNTGVSKIRNNSPLRCP
jgi:hypothetical protein